MSNRCEQPFQFSCQTCSSAIQFMISKIGGGYLKGADQIEEMIEFDDNTNFVDLHLDFPVSFGNYVPGKTPYMRAIDRIGSEAHTIHKFRLDVLNELYPLTSELSGIIRLYYKNTELFSKLCESKFEEKVASMEQKDINAALYNIIAKVFLPFAIPGDNAAVVDKYTKVINYLNTTNKAALDGFLNEIIQSNFLKNTQQDCLEIYPRILAAELPLRPALFLDFDSEYKSGLTAFRVSTDEFQEYKDLYNDISEVISRQLVLIAGVNNLLHRGDCNQFSEIGTKAPENLNQFADMPFGLKSKYLDDSWYKIGDGAADNQLRNSIAHYKTEYDETSQLISYYPRREGINQEKNETLYFLDFMRKILFSYREMHRMHQLIKCLLYYQLFLFE